MLLAGLSNGHVIGLSIVTATFVGFALVVSFLVPRRNPDFPGKAGIGVFAIVCIALFAAQLVSILVFGVEKSEAKGAEKTAATQGTDRRTIQVKETEFKIQLPVLKTVPPGQYTFVVQNAGKIPHNFAITGPKLSGPTKTPMIAAGSSAKLTVSLEKGVYEIVCTVPGHKALGMQAEIDVG